MTTTAVLLAAGLGTRMKSALPKALHPIAGRPMLQHLIASCTEVFDRIVVVAGPGMETLARAAAPHPVVVQAERLGTAHAALQAAAISSATATWRCCMPDNPLIRPANAAALGGAARHRRRAAPWRCWRCAPPTPAATAAC